MLAVSIRIRSNERRKGATVSTSPKPAPGCVTSVFRDDPTGATGVILATWILAELPGLDPELIRDDHVRFQMAGDPETVRRRLHGLMSERRFHGWRLSAAGEDNATPDGPDTCTSVDSGHYT